MLNLYKNIVDTVPLFFFIWDISKHKTIFISKKFYNPKVGDYYTAERSKVDLRDYIHPDSVEALETFFDELSEDNNYHNRVELQAAESLPEIHWLELTTYPMYESDGKLKYITGHILDLTSSKENKKALEEQVESLDTVTFMLAHELSAPVTTIMGLSRHLKKQVGKEDQENYLYLYDTIYNLGGEILTLARGLISLINLQSNKPGSKLSEIKVMPVLENIIEELYHESDKENSLDIQFTEMRNDITAIVNRDRFIIALKEMLAFIIKHINQAKSILINIFSSPADDEVSICISAPDLNLPVNAIKNILKSSTRLKMLDVRGKRVRGLLELVIVKEIAEFHKGTLDIYQHENRQGLIISFPKS